MILDTSAFVAMLRDEPEAGEFLNLVAQAEVVRMSTGSWLELGIVLQRGGDRTVSHASITFAAMFGLRFEPVTIDQANIARDAYRRYGKGTAHAAQLNFGDCFAFALARAHDEPLLFKGADFARTDVKPAWRG